MRSRPPGVRRGLLGTLLPQCRGCRSGAHKSQSSQSGDGRWEVRGGGLFSQSPRGRAAKSATTASPQKARRSSDSSHISLRDPEQAPAPVPFEDNLHFCRACFHRYPNFHFRWQNCQKFINNFRHKSLRIRVTHEAGKDGGIRGRIEPRFKSRG